jgi:hypothetical protein
MENRETILSSGRGHTDRAELRLSGTLPLPGILFLKVPALSEVISRQEPGQ